VRHKWSAEEEEELRRIYKAFFREGETPRQKDVEKGMKMSRQKGGMIHKIKRDNIKKKINNMIKKEHSDL
jgi:hypothetical protein